MNVLHVTSGTVPIHSDTGGGIERHIRSLTKELATIGHNVTIVDNEYAGENPESLGDVTVSRFDAPKVTTGLIDGWVDTVVSETLFAAKLGRSRSLIQDADVVHTHNAYVGARVARLAEQENTPFVYTCHNGMWCTEDVNSYEKQIVRRLEGRVLNQADAGIAVSGAVADGVERRTGYRPKVIHNGVDTNQFKPDLDETEIRKKYGLENKRIVLFVGRMSQAKGIDTLIKSISSVIKETDEDVRFVLVGPNVQMFGSESTSKYGERMRRLAEQEDVTDSLQVTGRVPEHELPILYAAADIFVLPSRFEALPMVLLEALASGTPLVGTNAGGIPEIVTEETGRVVPIADYGKLAGAISEILKLDSSAYKQMCAAARHRAETEYNWKVIAERIAKQYTNVTL